MIGRKISNFQITEQLGEGGMGTVYKATDRNLGRTVAIKMLHPFLTHDPDHFKRFQNEAHLSARITHPNVATLFDFQEFENRHFIVMEYVDGKPLDQVLKLQGRLPEMEAVKITLQVLEGLGAAHDLGITHRDLKPGNIMINKQGFVKLMDFGIAKLENAERITRQNSVIGTLEYLAPELIKGGNPSKASDLYAVGVMLYEMLMGTTLFKADTEAALMYQIAHTQPQLELSHVSKQIGNIVRKLTAKLPTKRFQDTREILDELEKTYKGGRVNTLLLQEKVVSPDIKPKAKVPLSLPALNLDTFKNVKAPRLPFDIDVRILAGAALLCLFILIIGVFRSGEETESDEDKQDQELSDNRSNIDLITDGNGISDQENQTIYTPVQEDRPQERGIGTIPSEKGDPKQTKPREEQGKQAKKHEIKSLDDVASEQKSGSQGGTDNKQTETKGDTPPAQEEKLQESQPKEQQTNLVKGKRFIVQGKQLSAVLSESVSTETHKMGQTVYLTTKEALVVDGVQIISAGASVKAIIRSLRKGGEGKSAFLGIDLVAVQAVDGQWVGVSYPEYSNTSRTEVVFPKGTSLEKIKIRASSIILNN